MRVYRLQFLKRAKINLYLTYDTTLQIYFFIFLLERFIVSNAQEQSCRSRLSSSSPLARASWPVLCSCRKCTHSHASLNLCLVANSRYSVRNLIKTFFTRGILKLFYSVGVTPLTPESRSQMKLRSTLLTPRLPRSTIPTTPRSIPLTQRLPKLITQMTRKSTPSTLRPLRSMTQITLRFIPSILRLLKLTAQTTPRSTPLTPRLPKSTTQMTLKSIPSTPRLPRLMRKFVLLDTKGVRISSPTSTEVILSL